ncbi:RuvC-like resolvase [Gordonia phage Mariokart]|nr:RuvC-like resolvase [Gordonia phage Mariokart]
MPRIISLDLSLTDTGVCDLSVADSSPLVSVPASARVTRVKSKASGTSWSALSTRIGTIVTAIKVILDSRPDLVVIESPALGSTTGQAHSRAWLWGKVYDAVAALGIPVITATPQGVKMYATGKGNADKDEVLAAVVKRYPDFDVTNNNTADAVVLAAIGARYLGSPIDSLAKTHLRAMDKLAK